MFFASLCRFLHFTLSGMKIVADYKKRKELKEYLPHQEHWKLKSDRKSGSVAPTSNTVLAQLSPNSAAEGETKVPDDTSEGKRKSPVEEEDEEEEEEQQQNGDSETPSSAKKRKYENGENEVRSHSETESTENGNGDGDGGGGGGGGGAA